ncbi:phenylacetate--CoA ligase [Oceanidesulfovibrio indonesiensis]|uniref:Phenylacetate-coenzyme A ligase n=1 Tax=Oceanidesulfovibrio indonesiensis TaxID=54767 RepID=A0A7M3MHC3_9BACT|nr:phenylacetate--CoA ligase [Oceanidesulfovibrio indonesiensis]TVM18885.1 phenylacetate--CoA ligase [Oceanidesulfovibrio indonesiensis]
MEIFHTAEVLSRDEIAHVQSRRLARTVKRAAKSPFYKARLAQTGVDPDSITSVDDISRLPLTTKDDLRESYPFGMLADEHRELVRLHASSGTTGSPTVVYHTDNDLRTWADLMARCMFMAGIRKDDVFQNMAGYGLFTGGLGIHYGAERLGCLTIPAGAGNTARQLKLIRDFNVTALHIIPSYALYLAGVVAEQGMDPRDLPPRIALIGAEPHSEEARRRIEEMLGLKAFNSYGLSEMNGPGVAFECEHQDGMHLWEDSYIAEILNPETLEPVAEGEVGELVMTTLTREAMPLLRYRTRDLTRFIPGECACGRTHRRIDRIAGRADDMLIIKGVNIYPMQIEQVLLAVPEVAQNYQIVLHREGFIDQLTVRVEIKEEFFVEDMRALGSIQKRIAGLLRNELLVTPRIELVEAKSLPTSDGKASRVVDMRDKQG